MDSKKKIIIAYRDNSFFQSNVLYSTIIIDTSDLQRIFPLLIREDIANVEIQEYDESLMNDKGEEENGK